MAKTYPFKDIEAKWQKWWEANGVYHAKQPAETDQKKYYGLIEFPYPSGEGLHVGHPRSYTAIDIVTRKKRMDDLNVLYPMGWDAFGLPAENFAIKKKIHPAIVTEKNIATFKRQIQSLGTGFDWTREINTTDPAYYKWTQWMFVQFFDSWFDESTQKARPIHELHIPDEIEEQGEEAVRTFRDSKRMAFKQKTTINWCPNCKIGLANEEAQGGVCERCGSPVEKRDKDQWMLRITKYADRLIKEIDEVDYLDKIKTQQVNWIGKSEGASINFKIQRTDVKEILFATGNPAKVERARKRISTFTSNVAVHTPLDLNLEVIDVKEGSDVLENAKKKAAAYEGKTDLPILAMDAALYIDKEAVDPAKVRRNALKGLDESKLNDQEIADKMIEYYKSIAQKHGGEAEAYWRDVYVLLLPDGRYIVAETKREIILTPEVRGEVDLHVPIRSMYKSKITGKYISEQTEADQDRELQCVADALQSLLEPVVTVFTTRPDTLFGATYLVLSPEHEFVAGLLQDGTLENSKEVTKYQDTSRKKSDIERQENKEKTGVELKGVKAINPANGQEIPVWIADYVLAGYGTGAIMAVPAHDERDFEFAKKFELPIKVVVKDRREFGDVDQEKLRKFNAELFKEANEQGFKMVLIGGLAQDVVKGSDTIHSDVDVFVDAKGMDYLKKTLKEKGFKEEGPDPSYGWQNMISLYHDDGEWLDLFLLEKSDHEYFDRIIGKKFTWGDESSLDKVDYHGQSITVPNADLLEAIYQNLVKTVSFCFTGDGIAVNSGFLDGLETSKATKKMIEWLEKNKHGRKEVNFKLRDWVFSRQRYWGEPIPMVHCDHCGWVPVQDSELPVLLPEVEKYEPTDTGESPLAAIKDWVKTTCPICGEDAERETDTMPNWAGSSWYFLRYADPHNKEAFASDRALRYWLPVDLYNGGMEHTTLHLLYSRFWYKLLFDLGHIPESCGVEPYGRRRSHAMILGEGGVKMSKSKGNVINPDDVVAEFGADVFRCYEMFMGPYDMDAPWDTHGIQGIKRFLDKVWSLHESRKDQSSNTRYEVRGTRYENVLHKTIKKVGDDIENLHFNTAISQLMILTNELQKADNIDQSVFEIYLKLLAPFAPHIAEELWQKFGHKDSIHLSAWPVYDESKLVEDTATVAVQVNGKVRAELSVPIDISEKEIITLAKEDKKVAKHLDGKEPKKVIYVPGKILNIVV